MITLVLAGVAVILLAVVALSVPIDRIAFVAVGVFVLFATWNGLRVGGGAIANVFLALAFAAVAAHVVVNRRAIPLPAWLLAASGGFVIAAILTLIFPPDPVWLERTLLSYRTNTQVYDVGFLEPHGNLTALFKFQTGMLLIPIMLAVVATTQERIQRLIDLFVISGVLNAAVGLIAFMGVNLFNTYAISGGRVAGLTLHPNYLALTCTFAIPLALLWVSRGGRWRNAGLVATLLLLGGAYVSGSRAGAVSGILAVVVTVAVLPQLRRALGFVLPVAGLILVPALIFTPAGEQVLEQLRFQGQEVNVAGSNRARSSLADLALQQFQARPVQGVGFSVIEDAHNIYLQVLAASGVIGMAALLTFIGGMFASMRRALGGPLREPAIAVGVSVAMWLVNGVFDSQLADKYLYVVPGILVAIACVAGARVPVREPETPVGDRGAVSPAPSLVGASGLARHPTPT